MINIFRVVSFLEGISYILLMFLGMPYKYLEALGKDPYFVKMFGMPHGILFVAYIALAVLLKMELKWDNKTFGMVCLLSILPFGTFFVGKYLKK